MEVRRYEVKYLLDPVLAGRIESDISKMLQSDIHDIPEGYRVRSLYFDTCDAADYMDRVNGICDRKKIRLRAYNPSDNSVKLEIKEKHGDLYHKISIPVNRNDVAGLEKGGFRCLMEDEDENCRVAYSLLRSSTYRPRLYVEYRRKAYIYNAFNVRVTFDKALYGKRYGEGSLLDDFLDWIPIANGYIVLEMKYDGCYPRFLNTIFDKYDITRASFGKYEQCAQILLAG